MTITVEQGDYSPEVEKKLKDYRKTAVMQGFRKGNVPMGIIRKLYSAGVKTEVVLNLVAEQFDKYVKENNIRVLGKALPVDEKTESDFAADTIVFAMDIAIAPEFDAGLSKEDVIDYYKIRIDDELTDRQVDMFASRQGQIVPAEECTADNDVLKGTLTELDGEGNAAPDGLTVADVMIMPEYVKDAEQKALFKGVKTGGRIVINPSRMYGETELAAVLKIDKEEAMKHTGDFSFEPSSIRRFEKHAINKELFDAVYGEGACADEAEFRKKIAEGLAVQLASDSDNRFLSDVRAYLEKRIDTLAYPEALLKKMMLAENDKLTEETLEKNFADDMKYLTWHLIRQDLVKNFNITVDTAAVKAVAKEATRVQFAQYGMTVVPDEYLENGAEKMMADKESLERLAERAVDVKLTECIKGAVTLNEKEISLDDFNKLEVGKKE